jgi:spore coat polysaccharide biosynthesis predicted glycosyltransferase SpsG
MKQTAVEWLLSKLPQRMLNYLKEEIEQAKEMEKQQMLGYVEHSYITRTKELEIHKNLFEQYYNETFKNK